MLVRKAVWATTNGLPLVFAARLMHFALVGSMLGVQCLPPKQTNPEVIQKIPSILDSFLASRLPSFIASCFVSRFLYSFIHCCVYAFLFPCSIPS